VTLTVSVPDAALLAAIGPLPGGVAAVLWDLRTPPPEPRIDLVVATYLGDWLSRLPAVAAVHPRLVQGQMLGYDGVADALPPGIAYANAATVHESSTAELALALILASQRGLDDFVRQAEAGTPVARTYPSLADRRVLLLGVGGVGAAIAARLAPFDVELVRVARSARTDELGTVHGMADLPQLLPTAEVVILAVPLDASTTGLVDTAFLAAMPEGSLLVNVARGPVVDTAALVSELETGRIRFAADVTDPEPLPAGHPLFVLPNALITPHVGGNSTAMLPRIAAVVRDQVTRMVAGRSAAHVVLGG
jgi:phosphoglycerate dehydrogenase-like enzyme